MAQLFSLGHLAHFWADSFEMSALRLVSSSLARAGFGRRADFELWIYERFDSPDII